MSTHIEANKEDISETVLMPGDPKRCEYIARKFLANAKLINNVRGMTAYTGYYKSKRITIFPSGMGIPSMGIYSYELYKFYDVENIIISKNTFISNGEINSWLDRLNKKYKITDKEKFMKEFTEVEDAYKEVTDSEMPKFFRPPMGKYSVASLKQTKELGYKTIFWSFAYKDWIIDNQPSEEMAIKKITSGVHPGCIMLLHAVSKTNTNVLKDVITQLKNEGYEFKSLNDLPEK